MLGDRDEYVSVKTVFRHDSRRVGIRMENGSALSLLWRDSLLAMKPRSTGMFDIGVACAPVKSTACISPLMTSTVFLLQIWLLPSFTSHTLCSVQKRRVAAFTCACAGAIAVSLKPHAARTARRRPSRIR